MKYCGIGMMKVWWKYEQVC